MSGFAGFLAPDRPPPPGRLAALAGALPAPDGVVRDTWTDAPGTRVGLAVVAHPADASLATDAASGRAALVDGRLAHADALARALGLARVPPSDAALVLAALDRHGPDALDRLDGSFAAAVWDAPARTLHLVRDAFGTRPLVYARHDGGWVFGSATAALLAAGVPREPDLWRVAEILTNAVVEREVTAFAAIRRLPPARRLTLGPEGASRTTVTWRPAAPRRAAVGALDGAVRETFEASVGTRLGSADAPGTLLSGGLDSSTITLALAAMRPGGIDAVSAVFPGLPVADEAPFQEAVAATGGIRRHVWSDWDVSPLASEAVRAMGVADPVWMNTWAMEHGLMQTARAAGIRTLFSGHGGDHLFDVANDVLVAEMLRHGRLARARREAAATAARWDASPRVFLREGARTLARWTLPAALRRRRMPAFGTELAPGLRAALDFDARARARWPLAASVAAEHALFLDHAITHDGLDRLTPVADALGLRFAFPFWDRPLVALSERLHPLDRLADGRSRPVIRRAFADRLPEALQMRTTKAAFDSMLFSSTVTHALAAYRGMLDAPGALADWADLDHLRAAVDRVTRSTANERLWGQTGDSQRLLRAYALWVWSGSDGSA